MNTLNVADDIERLLKFYGPQSIQEIREKLKCSDLACEIKKVYDALLALDKSQVIQVVSNGRATTKFKIREYL